MSQRVAIMVDGDNVSAVHGAAILIRGRQLGRVDVTRVYGGANASSDKLCPLGFRRMHAGAGKNAADLLLCIDAMELALLGGIDCFVLATSDGDFSHLAHRLRERGLHVLGLGEQKAPRPFQSACSDFSMLEPSPKPATNPVPQTLSKPKPAVAPVTVSDLDMRIRAMIAQHSQNGQGTRLVELAARMHSVHGVRIGTHPERNWRSYLSARPTLFALDPRGPDAMVRFIPAGFAA